MFFSSLSCLRAALLCAVGVIAWPPPLAAALTCADPPLASLPYCDPALSVAARVQDLLPRLNRSEKLSQFGMVGRAVPRLGIVAYNYGGEALHGVWSSCAVDNVSTASRPVPTGRTICPTQFPAPVHMSRAFSRSLWEGMADAAATEARGLYNNNRLRYPDTGGFGDSCAKSLEGCLGLSFYTPNINIARDGRWGRIEETPGEDPLLNGEYAKAFVKGFQSMPSSSSASSASSYYTKASVTVKHFAAYNLEQDLEGTDPEVWCGAPANQGGACALPNDRHSFNANVSALDLSETYAPAFRAAAQAGAGAIMCSCK